MTRSAASLAELLALKAGAGQEDFDAALRLLDDGGAQGVVQGFFEVNCRELAAYYGNGQMNEARDWLAGMLLAMEGIRALHLLGEVQGAGEA